MGCSKFWIILSICLCTTIHVQASRSSSISGYYSPEVSTSQTRDLSGSQTFKQIPPREDRAARRIWWQVSQKLLARQMGSKPPNCQDKCNYCHPCEAVEVPISNREVEKVKTLDVSANSSQKSQTLADPDDTNYMPESWRCACGDEYFNP